MMISIDLKFEEFLMIHISSTVRIQHNIKHQYIIIIVTSIFHLYESQFFGQGYEFLMRYE